MHSMLDMPAKQTRSGTPLGLRVDDELMDRIHKLRLRHRYPPTLTAMVEDALRRYCDEEERALTEQEKRAKR